MKEEVSVKLEGKKWEEYKEKALTKIAKTAQVDGFRPGKAPKEIVSKKYQDKIISEALDMASSDEYDKVIKEGKIIPIVRPTIELENVSNESAVFKIVLITNPKVTLGEYTNLGVKKETAKVTKKEISEAIEHLQNDYAEVATKDGAIKEGDTAIIDYEGFKDDIPFDGGKGENHSLEIGSHTFIPGFEEGLVGLSKGDKKDLELTFPEDYHAEELKGAKVVFKVKVNEVKERIVPKLDEDFFADLGMDDVKTKEDLEKKMEEELLKEKENKIENEYINKVIEKAVSNSKFDIAHELIHDEAHHIYEEMLENMTRYGVKEDLYLEYNKTTKEDMIHSFENEAEMRIKSRALASEIIKKEKLSVTDEEADKKAEELSKTHNVAKEEILKEEQALDMLKDQMLIEKVIEILKDNK